MRRLSSAQYSLALSITLLLFFCSDGETCAQPQDLKVEDYCRLTVSLMELSVREWNERVPVAEQNKGDRKKFQARLDVIAKKYQNLQNKSYHQFGAGRRAYLQYSASHAAEIESYLQDNPDVKGAIDSLKNQIDNLIQQFESAMPQRQEGGQQ
jgi:hypothetical protein